MATADFVATFVETFVAVIRGDKGCDKDIDKDRATARALSTYMGEREPAGKARGNRQINSPIQDWVIRPPSLWVNTHLVVASPLEQDLRDTSCIPQGGLCLE